MIVNNWKQPECMSTEELMNVVYAYNEYYVAVEINEVLSPNTSLVCYILPPSITPASSQGFVFVVPSLEHSFPYILVAHSCALFGFLFSGHLLGKTLCEHTTEHRTSLTHIIVWPPIFVPGSSLYPTRNKLHGGTLLCSQM